METSDLLLTFIIIVIFIALYFINILGVGIKNIKDNWPLYRCNPLLFHLPVYLIMILDKISHIVYKICNKVTWVNYYNQ